MVNGGNNSVVLAERLFGGEPGSAVWTTSC